MHNTAHALLGHIDGKVGILRGLIRVIDTGEALDLATTSLGVDPALVSVLTVLERRVDVDEEEGATEVGDGLAGSLTRVLVGGDRGRDDGGTGAGEFACDEGDALDVGVAVFAAEAEFGGELVADGVTQQQGDGAAALLVEGDLESTRDGVLAGVHVTREEDGEALQGARGAGLAQDLDDFRVGEPFRDVSASAETLAQLSAGDVQSADAGGDFVLGLVFVGVRAVGDLLELDDLDAQLVLVLFDGVLGVVGSVEVDALGVLTGTGVVTTNDEVRGTMVLTDDGVPDGLARATHTHGQGQETQDGHTVGVAGEESLVGAHTGEVVNVTRLGQTDDGVDEDVGLLGAGGAHGHLTVGTVHGVTGLEGDDSVPAELVEVNAQFRGSVAQGDIVVVVELVEGLDFASNVELFRFVVEVVYGGVGLVATKDFLSFLGSVLLIPIYKYITQETGELLVRTVDIVNGQNGQVPVISEVAQGDTRTGLEAIIGNGLLGDIEGDGHGEEVSISQTDIFTDTVVN